MRPKLLRLAAIVGVTVVALLLVVPRSTGHKLIVNAYFANAEGLRVGAVVRAAGVEIGSVRSVRVRPELKEEPVEVVMVINPPYEIKIPNDTVVSIRTAGILGAAYVEINAAAASGPAIGNNAVLKSRPIEQMSAEQLLERLERLSKDLEKKNFDCGTLPENATRSATPAGKSSTSKPTR
jgi:phospholipid/cholesterol/gamma-HCH transport system substrate-binding protein